MTRNLQIPGTEPKNLETRGPSLRSTDAERERESRRGEQAIFEWDESFHSFPNLAPNHHILQLNSTHLKFLPPSSLPLSLAEQTPNEPSPLHFHSAHLSSPHSASLPLLNDALPPSAFLRRSTRNRRHSSCSHPTHPRRICERERMGCNPDDE